MSTGPGRLLPSRPVIPKGEPPYSGPAPLRQPDRPGSSANKSRTSHACDRCRVMRTKCSGGDRCTKCVKDNAGCVYGDRKRERNKKDLAECLDRIDELKRDNHALLTALRSLTTSDEFDAPRHGDILELLSQYSQEPSQNGYESGGHSTPTVASSKQRPASHRMSYGDEHGSVSGEKTAASSVGSPGKQGELAEVVDLGGGSGASGFIGKMSEMSWIRRAFELMSYQERNSTDLPEVSMGVMDHHLTTTKDFCFYMDDVDILAFDEDLVDPYEWPPGESALLLTEAYFHCMQGTLPFVMRENFLHTLLSYPRRRNMPTWAERRWLALANLVWAIGSKWLYITKLDQSSPPETHLVYYARARALGLDHRVVFDHPDIERVQGIGVLALYLLINGSITRAWNTLGHATRHATALGLHLRVSDPDLGENERARRVRTWYALYSLEILIAEITGRPKSIFLSDVTTPVDLFQRDDIEAMNLAEGNHFITAAESRRVWLDFLRARREISQTMTGVMVPWTSFPSIGRGISHLYFPQRVYLCRLSDKIGTRLYSGTSEDSWSQVQQKIGELQTDLRHWAESLPDELNLQSDTTEDSDPRARIELAMYYHSVQMILHRPCLCEVIIENQSHASQEFNRSSARACVHAAMSLLAIIPDNPSAHEAYQLLPWWSLLHYVAQATAVLLLEMALGCQHFQNEIPEVVNYLRKAMAYIWCLSQGSPSAYRAWRMCRKLLSDIQDNHDQYHAIDIPERAPKPANWTLEHEAAVMKTIYASEVGSAL
ncbi:hypothetical protein PV08_10322 [Exophiala spinifera]|uniref:Zn(2)-C6 fungal-type domain-containing protein n=1 Tax=Exophiala spinifera TaxID=91928 RepID=A0A0D2AWF9_9EURO|nr:uncharacterized protein PV08_10322 [Exophiala spinifera]KIW11023.1 hypothetical protein PV08_10322 [Exophiala spinifera]